VPILPLSLTYTRGGNVAGSHLPSTYDQACDLGSTCAIAFLLGELL